MDILQRDFEAVVQECRELVPEIPISDRACQRVAGKSVKCFVAQTDGTPAAFAVGWEEPDGFYYLLLFGVAPDARRGGIGSGVLEHLEVWASTAGYCGIRLQSRNKYPQMLRLVIGRGYKIVAFIDRDDIDASPIRFEKRL